MVAVDARALYVAFLARAAYDSVSGLVDVDGGAAIGSYGLVMPSLYPTHTPGACTTPTRFV